MKIKFPENFETLILDSKNSDTLLWVFEKYCDLVPQEERDRWLKYIEEEGEEELEDKLYLCLMTLREWMKKNEINLVF